MNVEEHPAQPFPFDPLTAPPEHRKDGTDWFAVFNPSALLPQGEGINGSGRRLDVNLNHTLMHESVVCCVRFSADGKYLATGCNRTAQIYDVKSGAKIWSVVICMSALRSENFGAHRDSLVSLQMNTPTKLEIYTSVASVLVQMVNFSPQVQKINRSESVLSYPLSSC